MGLKVGAIIEEGISRRQIPSTFYCMSILVANYDSLPEVGRCESVHDPCQEIHVLLMIYLVQSRCPKRNYLRTRLAEFSYGLSSYVVPMPLKGARVLRKFQNWSRRIAQFSAAVPVRPHNYGVVRQMHSQGGEIPKRIAARKAGYVCPALSGVRNDSGFQEEIVCIVCRRRMLW